MYCHPTMKNAAKLAIDVGRKGGRCLMVGVCEEPSEFNFFEIVATEKQIIGALACNGEFADVIALIADGCLDVTPRITGRIKLEHSLEQGFEELVNNKDQNVKLIVRPSAPVAARH